jgi:hypothetical protein
MNVNCANMQGGPVPDNAVFKYQLVGTWGYSPKVDHWIRFSNLVNKFMATGKRPDVPATTKPGTWLKKFEKEGRCPGVRCFWEINHIYYSMLFPDRWSIYLKAPQGTTMSANWQEAGLHYAGNANPRSDAPVHRTHMSEPATYHFPAKPHVVTWDGKLHDDRDFVGHEHHNLADREHLSEHLRIKPKV